MAVEMKPIEAPSVRELFSEQLVERMLHGDLVPGEQLPAERELAAQAHISKSAVHLALADLERMGFVETKERQGTYVADFAKNGNVLTLEMLSRSKSFRFDRQKTIDILEMRDGIETKALERLAGNLTEENRKTLTDDLEETKRYCAEHQPVEVEELAHRYFHFHHDICVCSGNFVLPLLFNTFEQSTTYFWELPIREFGSDWCMEMMQGMYDAILTGESSKSIEFFRNEIRIYREELADTVK